MSTPVALAAMVATSPQAHWGTTQCAAWIESAEKRCTKRATQGHLCKRHHNVALGRWAKHVEKEKARRAKAIAKREAELPRLLAERDRIRARINQLDPPDHGHTQAYVGEVHPNIRKQQQARLSDARVSELASLYDRLERLNKQIGGTT